MKTQLSLARTQPWPIIYGVGFRMLALVLAASLAGLIILYPDAIAYASEQLRRAVLLLIAWGVVAGVVHGVGYVPRHPLWRALLSPTVGLPLAAGSLVFVLAHI